MLDDLSTGTLRRSGFRTLKIHFVSAINYTAAINETARAPAGNHRVQNISYYGKANDSVRTIDVTHDSPCRVFIFSSLQRRYYALRNYTGIAQNYHKNRTINSSVAVTQDVRGLFGGDIGDFRR